MQVIKCTANFDAEPRKCPLESKYLLHISNDQVNARVSRYLNGYRKCSFVSELEKQGWCSGESSTRLPPSKLMYDPEGNS